MPDDSGITLAEAKTALAAWVTADAALASGAQEYRINAGGVDRLVKRVDAAVITTKINYYQNLVKRLANGGVRVRGVIF